MTEKYLGYALLAFGLCIIAIGGYSVYAVFTGQIVPFALFNFDAVTVPLSALLGAELALGANSLPDVEIFPAAILNSTTNTLAHLLLMGFVVSVGYRVAMIGVNLLRPIVVKMTTKNPSVLDPK